MLQDDRSERSDILQDEFASDIHRTSQCENCRYVKALYEADCQRKENERRRKRDEEDAIRRRAENRKQIMKGAKRGATALTGLGILTDVAEIALGGV